MEKFFEKNMNPNHQSLKIVERLEKEELPRFSFLKDLKAKFSTFSESAKGGKEPEIYLVGGAVRDLLLDRKIEDYDFLIRKVKKEDLEVFLKEKGAVNFVGRAFGIFKFIPKGPQLKEAIDIALPRQDFSLLTGSRHDFKIKTDPELPIEEDLKRRDFTINALAIELEPPFKLIDIAQGKKDLEKGLIRAVGAPRERFKEDCSRILRAIRFACQFDFKIEEKTFKELKNQVKNLNRIRREVVFERERKFFLPGMVEYRIVPYEIIAKEMLRSFYYDPLKTIEFYEQSGIFKELMPEVLKMKGCPQPQKYHSEGDVWTHSLMAVKNLYSPEFKKEFGEERPSSELILATFFHDIGKPYVIKTPEKDKTERIRFDGHDEIGAELSKEIAERLKLSSPKDYGVDSKRLAWLVRNHMIFVNQDIEKIRARTIEKYFFHHYFKGEDLLKLGYADIMASIPLGEKPDFTNFYKMKQRIEEIKKLSASKKEAPQPLLAGDEIMKKFSLEAGPLIGRLLSLLREEQLSKRVKTGEEAYNFLKEFLTKKEKNRQ